LFSFLEQTNPIENEVGLRSLFNQVHLSDEYRTVDWVDFLLKRNWDDCYSIVIDENEIKKSIMTKESLILELPRIPKDVFSLVRVTESWVVFIHNVLGNKKIIRIFIKK
jgi:hypothetical protein